MNSGESKGKNYCIEISETNFNRTWDEFLAQNHMFGHYEQTTAWARFKSNDGWTAQQIIVRKNEDILGGAQILIQRKRILGKIGYLRWGPLFRVNDFYARKLWIKELDSWAKKNRIT